jgi:hypothetical protein
MTSERYSIAPLIRGWLSPGYGEPRSCERLRHPVGYGALDGRWFNL